MIPLTLLIISVEQFCKNDLLKLAKKSIIKEMIRESEILKYKEIDFENPRNENILRNIILNLDFSNQLQFESYLNNFGISIDDIKKKLE